MAKKSEIAREFEKVAKACESVVKKLQELFKPFQSTSASSVLAAKRKSNK